MITWQSVQIVTSRELVLENVPLEVKLGEGSETVFRSMSDRFNHADPAPMLNARTRDALVARAPDRLLWATNWPHPGQADPPTLERLAELRDRWLPTAELRQQVLVDNPAHLYDF